VRAPGARAERVESQKLPYVGRVPAPPAKATVSRLTSSASAPRPTTREPRFLYVEGPRDREIIEGWSQRVSRSLAECVRESTVILGGRQPARACEHLAEARAEHLTARGLCVLDRDRDHSLPDLPAEAGLELFVWSRRHIESYLLVPPALRRVLRDAGPRAIRSLADGLPEPDDERGWRDLDAKRRLAATGQRFPWGRVARSLRNDELHPDVRELLARLTALFGVATPPHLVQGAP
jgi:hypothetical protein